MITEAEIRADERRKCWEELSVLIQPGSLAGNGCDEVAQRNGIILAANHLARIPTDYDDHVLRRKKPQPNPKPR